jgi:formate dehydrogenase subunit beta
MERVVGVLDVRDTGAVAAVQHLLWRLMERDVVQGLLVPLQTHAREAPAPTLIKTRERLEKANPLAPVMTLNSANIVGLLLAQESGKRLAAVLRPCEARALMALAEDGQVSLDDLVTISVDCLGSHDAEDYQQRAALWGDEAPTRESLRWSRRGQIAAYRFRDACQICEQPVFEDADISIGLYGQRVDDHILVFMRAHLAEQIDLYNSGGRTRPATENELTQRRKTVADLIDQRHLTRQRLLDDIQSRTEELANLLTLFGSCTLCSECQEACPLESSFDFEAHEANTPEYVAARLLDIVRRSESCVGCGMCEAACHLGIPLMLVTQMIGERTQVRNAIINALAA